jgi:arsenite methyltransferase
MTSRHEIPNVGRMSPSSVGRRPETAGAPDPEWSIDPFALRDEVRAKYTEVATDPAAGYHFHTGRRLAERCGYEPRALDEMPDTAVESFAGVGNPFDLRRMSAGERVVDVGSGGGLDSLLAARAVGRHGYVVGVDMTLAMVSRARRAAKEAAASNVEFCSGLAEVMPVADGWADTVISNGVFNLCADKQAAFTEVRRALRPGGVLQFADIANGRDVPPEAMRDIDLWTG